MKRLHASARVVLALILAIVFCAVVAHAEKVATLPEATGYIDDYASVLSADAKSDLEFTCRDLHDKTRAQIFLVTVNTLDGEPVEQFANELFAKWKIGEKKTDRGVLLLFAIKDHKRWIEVGYGLEGILNDAKVGDIGREMVPLLKASNYDEAARTSIRDVSTVIATDSGVTLDSAEPLNQTAPPIPEGIGQPSAAPWPLLLLPFFFLAVFVLIVWSNIRNRSRGYSHPYYVPGPGVGYVPGSTFGNSSASSSSYDSGSSFSGGDSGSSSGSSDSGSFSGGDGGSSGGGGAGGDW
jgi:uncharacterized protein